MNTDTTVLLTNLLKTLPYAAIRVPRNELNKFYRKTIEILPEGDLEWSDSSDPTYPYLLQQGNLGVPQKALRKAYVTACRLHQETRRSSVRSPDILIDSTSVILLANPAHQTALNGRKRLVLRGELDALKELDFTSSLLSCRECTKESILWHHRRWLLRRIHRDTTQAPQNGVIDETSPFLIPPKAANEEFAVISRACESYPRNYHAWAHRYFCMRSLSVAASSSRIDSEVSQSVTTLMEEYQFTLRWIDQHISDYSAMQYMCRLEQTIHSLSLAHPALSTSLKMTISPHTHARSLLHAYPNHESLWMYLRSYLPAPKYPNLADTPTVINGKPDLSSFLLRHLAWTVHLSRSFEFSGPLAREVISGDCSETTRRMLQVCPETQF